MLKISGNFFIFKTCIPVWPSKLVELGDEFLLTLPIYDEDDRSAAGLQESHHPVVSLSTKLVDLQLRHHFAFLVNFQTLELEKKSSLLSVAKGYLIF